MSKKYLTPSQLGIVNEIRRHVSGLKFQSVYSQLDEIEHSLNYDVSRNPPDASRELIDSQNAERELLALRKQQSYN